MQEEHARQIEKLKEVARKLIKEEKEVMENLELIDAVQQLGLDYHFEEEIMDVLVNIYRSLEDIIMVMEQDLHAKALLFRLLREHGFTVSQDIFDSFKDGTSSFKSSLGTSGLLSLYQASYYAMEGEDTLDEARDFTSRYLNRLIKGSSDSVELNLKEQIIYFLKLPLNRRLKRVHCRWYIERYHRDYKNWNPNLLELSKLDFNMIQSVHKTEIKKLSRWWTDHLGGEKLSFSRDRLVENYLASAVWVYEPNLSRCREALTKFDCFLTALDDIYDIYGTLEELELFTDAVERWELNALEELPEYMKIYFLALFSTASDIAYQTLKDKCVDVIPYFKKMWADQCKAYLVEARWYHKGYTPTFEEYLENARITTAAHVVLTAAYCVNEDVTSETLKHFKSYPQDLMQSPSIIFRLCNDMITSKEELSRGDVSKSVECYMHEKGVLETLARDHMWDLISLSWKKMNGELRFTTSSTEKFLRNLALNYARSAHLFYQYEDGYGMNHNGETKDCVISLFVKPILL